MHRKEAQDAIEVQDVGYMRQHAAKNSADGVVRECLESFVRAWTDCPEAISLAGGMEARAKWRGGREIQQAKHVPLVRFTEDSREVSLE